MNERRSVDEIKSEYEWFKRERDRIQKERGQLLELAQECKDRMGEIDTEMSRLIDEMEGAIRPQS